MTLWIYDSFQYVISWTICAWKCKIFIFYLGIAEQMEQGPSGKKKHKAWQQNMFLL